MKISDCEILSHTTNCINPTLKTAKTYVLSRTFLSSSTLRFNISWLTQLTIHRRILLLWDSHIGSDEVEYLTSIVSSTLMIPKIQVVSLARLFSSRNKIIAHVGFLLSTIESPLFRKEVFHVVWWLLHHTISWCPFCRECCDSVLGRSWSYVLHGPENSS